MIPGPICGRWARLSPTTLLLVDDNPVFLGLLIAFFERSGMANLAIRTARSAEEGMALAREIHPDLVTVDLTLAGTSGVEAIGQLRAILPSAAIVALTEHEEEVFRTASLAAGADDFVPKSDLVRRVLPALVEARHRRAHHVNLMETS